MEKHPPLPMTPFDSMVTSPELQMMKLMLPYTPSSYRRFMAFYIKFIELQNTIRHFGLFGSGNVPDAFGRRPSSPMDILEDLKPYMGKEAETMDMILNAMNMMEMMKGMEMDGMPGMNMGDMAGMNMGDLSGMMDIMNMFSNSNSGTDTNNENNETWKGNDDNERMDESPGNEEYRSSEAGTDQDSGQPD